MLIETDTIAAPGWRPQSMAKRFIVAVYLVNRTYGGPAEGGWWYDEGDLVRIVRVFKNEDRAISFCRRLNARLNATLNAGRRPLSSVLSEGEFHARIEDDFAPKHFPDTRQFYS